MRVLWVIDQMEVPLDEGLQGIWTYANYIANVQCNMLNNSLLSDCFPEPVDKSLSYKTCRLAWHFPSWAEDSLKREVIKCSIFLSYLQFIPGLIVPN